MSVLKPNYALGMLQGQRKRSLAALNKQTVIKSDLKVSIFSEENRFRMVKSKLHFSKGLYSMECIKVTKKRTKKKIPVRPRILTAVLFIGSRHCSLMINED